MKTLVSACAALLLAMLAPAAVFAQGTSTNAAAGILGNGYPSSQLQGSLSGTPGLWSAQFAEILAPGQVSGGAYVSRYTRNPGGLVITDAPSGLAVGITSWLELSFDFTAYRRIRLNDPNELTFAALHNFANFNPVAPFARNPLLTGPVGEGIGLTFGLLSQDRGAPFGLAWQVHETLPYTQDYAQTVDFYGVSTGEAQFNENVLLDKWMGNAGEIVANVGYQHTNAADAGGKIFLPFRDEIVWSFGVEFPRQARLQVITELNGDSPFGAGPHSNYFGPTSPMDSTWGIRLNATEWMGFNAAYRLADTSPHANDSGFVFGLSVGPAAAKPAPPPPPPPPPPPTVACSASDTSVMVGASVQITASATPGNPGYTYTWTTTGGRVAPAQDHATLNTAGLAPGMYTVTVHVANTTNGSGDCKSSVEVRVPVHHPPVATCTVTPTSSNPGGTFALQATATSPDNAAISATSWTIGGGLTSRLDNSGRATARLDTSGVNPGNYNATATVTDANGQTATCSAAFQVIAPPAAPAPQLVNSINFAANSSRVDNKAKAALDDYALLLERNPDARGVIVGYATPNELRGARALTPANATKLAEQRAVNAKAYLVDVDHIAADRLEVRQDGSIPAKADLWEVPAPQAAPYNGPGQTFDENTVKPAKQTPVPKPGGTH